MSNDKSAYLFNLRYSPCSIHFLRGPIYAPAGSYTLPYQSQLFVEIKNEFVSKRYKTARKYKKSNVANKTCLIYVL